MTPSYRKLSLFFDPLPLRADLSNIRADEWVPHFNTRYYEGSWSGVSLRSVGGTAAQLYPDPTAQGRYADTQLLARCPNIRTALERFECPLLAVRLLRLKAGSSIREHKDYNLGFEDGEIRLHIPLLTNSGVEFFLDGERLTLSEGECWYINFNLRHRVENYGASDRIHLVIDCVVNDWLRSQFPHGWANAASGVGV